MRGFKSNWNVGEVTLTCKNNEEIASAATSLAQELASGAPNAAGVAKTVIYRGYESDLEEAGDFEAQNIVRAAGTNDGQEGISAFVERRDPKWTGT